MRTLFAVVPLLTSLAATIPADALAQAAPKVGYVDMARALNEVEDGKAAKAKLKSDFEGKQKKLDSMQNDLKAKKEEFDKKSSMMKPEVKAEKQDELQRSFVELQQTYVQLQKELMDRESRITQEIAGKLRNVIAKLGDRDSYTMVLDIGETVLYYKRHQDVTDEVVREYNQQYGTSGSGSAAASKK